MVSLVCDSSALISLADTCNVEALYFLKQKLGAALFIPPSVYEESIARPMKIWRYELSAVRLMKAFRDEVLGLVKANAPELSEKTKTVLEAANALFEVGRKTLTVLHEGEAQCIAALDFVSNAALLVDEKTARLLIESPELLLQALETEYADAVRINEDALEDLRAITSGVKVLRSSEVLSVVSRRGYFDEYSEAKSEAFHASLYALKSAGCSISFEELKEYMEEKL